VELGWVGKINRAIIINGKKSFLKILVYKIYTNIIRKYKEIKNDYINK